ncbi:MAG: nicotinate-nucleotide diphosphorylase (carboxylating) [Syntrophus sp. (in: bacteria)]|nr:nicotinate-nucleotide diphosphorylase (carboxylating) [Syntrophus sp. (in: bacteria)]
MEKDIQAFLAEDIGQGDVTTDSIVPEDHISEAVIIAKEDCVIAGHAFVKKVFEALDIRMVYKEVVKDGEAARIGETVSIIKGRTRAILTGERVALNLFQRFSGIAAATRRFVDALEGTGVVILDTRKTTPGLRAMEKYAVRMGGGQNHRFDLGEMALIKENHIAAAGSIRQAVAEIRNRSRVAIEVEVKNMNELKEAVAEHTDRIMLDNWGIEETRTAVAFVGGRVPLEASGNMTIQRVREVALTGVNFISVGAITHSFKSADLSLLIKNKVEQ